MGFLKKKNRRTSVKVPRYYYRQWKPEWKTDPNRVLGEGEPQWYRDKNVRSEPYPSEN